MYETNVGNFIKDLSAIRTNCETFLDDTNVLIRITKLVRLSFFVVEVRLKQSNFNSSLMRKTRQFIILVR